MNGTNEVDVDVTALQREAASIDLGPEPAPGGEPGAAAPDGAQLEGTGAEPSPEEIQRMAAGAKPVVAGVLAALHGVVAPAWVVEPQKMAALVDASSLALAYWFPAELPPKYVALVMVAGALYGIAQDNRDPATGAYKPRYAPPKDKPADGATTSA